MSADSEKPNIIVGNWTKYCTVVGGVEKKLHEQPQKKKGGRKRQCPALCEVCLRPSSPALPAFSYQGPSNDYPCACFARFRLSDGCPGSFPSACSDVEENCLTLQLSSAVVRLVLEEKLSAFSLRAVATFTLFDQVSRACP